MRRFGVTTKKEAVDLALRRLVGEPLTPDFLRDLEGIGWEGDLEPRAATGNDLLFGYAIGQAVPSLRPTALYLVLRRGPLSSVGRAFPW